MPISISQLPQVLQSQAELQRQNMQGQQAQALERLKSYLQGQAQQRALGQVQQFMTKDAQGNPTLTQGQGLSISPEGASISRGFNPYQMMISGQRENSAEAQKVDAAKQKTLGKMEEGLGMAQNAMQFLQNPNAYNVSELKVLVPMMQGWPARAIGTESKASGFDAGGWNSALQELNKYADNPQGNPLTQNTINTLRSNAKTLIGNLNSRYQKANQNFWGSTAPSLAPTLAGNGVLDRLQSGHDQMIQNTYGDFSKMPWEQGQQAQRMPSQPVQNTPPVQAPSVMDRLKSFFSPGGGKPQQLQQAPQQEQDPIAAELAKRAQQSLNQPQQPQQQPSQ